MIDHDDDLDNDLLDDDDTLDSYAAQGGAKALGNPEDQLSAKYADYLMWQDTGSSHDEALDLAGMTEAEHIAAENADNADSAERSSFGSLDGDEDDLSDDEDEDDGFSSRGRGGRSSDNDDY